MIEFTTTVLRFGEMGEKTGWTYVLIPEELAQQLKPNNRKSFRVKGMLDAYAIRQIAVMPMGDGSFLLNINADARKATGKRQGSQIRVALELDDSPILPPDELMECLADEPSAMAYWESISGAHRNYFIKHIESAKTVETRARRVAQSLAALQQRMDYGQMIRAAKAERQSLGR
jgi:hypothetical protein